MIYLSQKDPRWIAICLGNTNLPIGKIGCTITDLSMLSDYFGQFKMPKELAQQLKFTSEGLVIWSSLPEVLNFRLEKRLFALNNFEIDNSLKALNRAVILNIAHGTHWVTALRKSYISRSYVCLDPLTGQKRNIYWNEIVGSAHFIKL